MYIFAVDCCCPGDVVTITAIVKATGSDAGHGGRSSKDHCTFLLYLYAISVSNDKLLAEGEPSPSSLHVEFSTKVTSYILCAHVSVVCCYCRTIATSQADKILTYVDLFLENLLAKYVATYTV